MFLFSIWMMLCVKFIIRYFSRQIDRHGNIAFYTAYAIKHHNCPARPIKECICCTININIYFFESCLMLCVYQMLHLIFRQIIHTPENVVCTPVISKNTATCGCVQCSRVLLTHCQKLISSFYIYLMLPPLHCRIICAQFPIFACPSHMLYFVKYVDQYAKNVLNG